MKSNGIREIMLQRRHTLCAYVDPQGDRSMTDDRRMWASVEAARELGLSVPQLRRLADAGRVPFEVTAGGHRRFDVSAVRSALIAAGRLPSRIRRARRPTWESTEAARRADGI